VMPGIVHWQHPGWFAYFPANSSYESILGELASAGLGVQGMLWSTSPACTEIETHVLDWLVHALGLPERFLSSGDGGGVLQDTASSAALVALVAARERATGFASDAYQSPGGVASPLAAPPQRHSTTDAASAARSRAVGTIGAYAMRRPQSEAFANRSCSRTSGLTSPLNATGCTSRQSLSNRCRNSRSS